MMWDKFEIDLIDSKDNPEEKYDRYWVILNRRIVFSSDDPRKAIDVRDLMVKSFEAGKGQAISALQQLPRFTEITFLDDSVFSPRPASPQ